MRLNLDWNRLKKTIQPKLALKATSFRTLKASGVLGMNARNFAYIHRYNDRHNYPKVDDKLQTKLLAQKANLPVPTLLGVVRYQHQANSIRDVLMQNNAFVIKPSRGSAGKGILVISRREGTLFYKPSGVVLTWPEVQRHISNILSGLYSLGGMNDVAMVEELIQFTDSFEGYSYQGVPDVRIIVFKGYPIMAMTRLSTQKSDGKANLHQGAVGVGIDIATGKACDAVQFDRRVEIHPDTRASFRGFKVPQWHRHLLIATKCYEMTDLGYLGVDVVLDKVAGPLILELNARPGLAIQTANREGLLKRLEWVESLPKTDSPPPPADRVKLVKEAFCKP